MTIRALLPSPTKTQAAYTSIASRSKQLAFGKKEERAHEGMIDLYNHPDLYDKMLSPTLKEDIPFYLTEVPTTLPALEVTAGTGRITIPLAQKGVDITGLDLSESMLRKAMEKAQQTGAKVNLVQGNATHFQLDRKFGTIIVPASGLLLLNSKESIENFLMCAKKHLLPNGRLIFDVIPSTSPMLNLPKDFKVRAAKYRLPNGTPVRVTSQDWNYNPSNKIFSYSTVHENTLNKQEVRKDTSTFKIYTPEELRALLYKHGFCIKHEYGDFSKNLYKSDSLRQIMICTLNTPA